MAGKTCGTAGSLVGEFKKTEVGRRKSEDGSRKTGVGRRESEDGSRKTEDGSGAFLVNYFSSNCC